MQRSEDGALTHASRAEDGSAKQGKTPESSKGGSMKAGRRGQGAGTPPSTDQSRRPAKQIKEAAPSSSQLMQGTPYPGQSGSLGNPPWGQYGGAEDDGCGGHDDREHDAHAAAAAATQHADGALQLGDGGGGAAAAAADAPLTETVAAGLVAMASRRAVLLDKVREGVHAHGGCRAVHERVLFAWRACAQQGSHACGRWRSVGRSCGL